MNTIVQDIRYGFRTLLNAPGFTFIAIISLALGIGANTAIFSIIDSLMLKELPVRHPESLVLVGDGKGSGIWGGVQSPVGLISEPQLAEIRNQKNLFQDATGVWSFRFDLHPFIGNNSASEPIHARLVTGNYFMLLGVEPAAGALFTNSVDQPLDAHPDVVISYGFWKRRFNLSPSTVGKTMRIGDRIFTIVGVAAPDFFGTTVGESMDAWLPLSMSKDIPPYLDFHNEKTTAALNVLARLQPGVSRTQAAAGLTLLYRRFVKAAMGTGADPRDLHILDTTPVELTPAANGLSQLRNQFSLSLRVLMVVVGLVLLIACANVANLLLARATAREKEIAIRSAIGSGRSRVIRQLLTESLLLSCTGGVLGILMATWGSQILLSLVSSGPNPIPLNVDPNWRILGFTVGLSVLTGLVFGMAPAWRASTVNPNSSLREGGRGGTAGRSRMFAGRALVVLQVGLSLVLLVGAGLFLKSFRNLESVRTGFSREQIVQVDLDTDASGLPHGDRLSNLYEKLEERVSGVPGVESAALAMFTFHQGMRMNGIGVDEHPEIAKQGKNLIVDVTGPDFAKTMGINLIAGRYFGRHDTATSPKVAVINESAAHDIFGKASPIGKTIRILDGNDKAAPIQVIGVVNNVKFQNLDEKQEWAAYMPYTQASEYLSDFVIKYRGDQSQLIAQVRKAVAEVDRNVPFGDVTTMSAVVDRSLTTQHLVAQLSTFFGGLALLLAAIGLYGVLSYSVARRTSEIGVRMALGAQSFTVLRMILQETLLLIGLGVVLGVPAALLASRYIESLLYGLKGTDATTIVIAVVVLAAIGTFAGFLPARRASNVDPMVALRYE